MSYTYIYTLNDPITHEVRYVGKSNNPRRRYYGHLRGDKTATTHKINWVQALLHCGLKPELFIVNKVPVNEWKYWERYFIEYFKHLGNDIINHTLGGDGLSVGNQTSFKKGQRPWNTGTRKKKPCVICGKLFEVSPTGDLKYKCCSMKCSCVYRSNNPNSGCFKKGVIPVNITPVLQIDKNTGVVLKEYASINIAQQELGITHISCVLSGKRRSAGGYLWEKVKGL